MSPTQYLLLAVLSVLWGGTYLFVGIAIRELPPATIVLARVGLAALALAPIALALGHRLPATLATWQPFVVMAILNNLIPFTLIATGQQWIGAGLASVLNATTPLFTLIVAHLFTDDEKLGARKLAGILLGIAGVAILIGPDALAGATSSVVGMALCLAACLSYGCAGLWGRRLRSTPPLVSAAAQLTASTVMLAVIAALFDRPWTLAMPSVHTLVSLVVLALASTALAYVIFFRILAVSGPTNVMLVTLLIPISGIALGALVLGEAILARHILGALVIASGLLVIDGRLLSLLQRRERPMP